MYLRDLEFLIDPFENVEVNVFAWKNDEEYYVKTIFEPWYKCALRNCTIICIKSRFSIELAIPFLSIDVFDHDSPIG